MPGRPKDPAKYEAWRKALSDSHKKRLADPEVRAAHLERMNQHCRQAERDYSKQNTAELRQKRREFMLKKWADPEYKAKLKAIMATDEWKAKSRKAHIEHYEDNPSARARISEATKQGMAKPEVQEKLKRAACEMWQDEKMSEHLLTILKSPEGRQKRGAKIKLAFQDPEYKARWYAAVFTEENRAKSRLRILKPENQEYRARRCAEAMANWNKPTRIEIAVKVALDELQVEYIPQHPIGRYIVDFFIPQLNLVLECDGAYWHSSEEDRAYDCRRDRWMTAHGYKVTRLPEADIKADAHQATLMALASSGFALPPDQSSSSSAT